jgi:chromosomal replication initiation ATPase DnaA
VDLNPRFRFETFVVGAGNQVAATAARSVAESPGTTYNPLFIYGKSGLGKTHLLQSIGFLALERQATLRTEYLTLEEFVERYNASVAAGQLDAFRRSAQETDLLLLDDVQFLAEHLEMQAELLRLSEAMQAVGRQVVVTCDRPPGEIGGLDERLVTRLSGGLLVDVAAPDFETRLAILHRKAEERGADLSPAVLETVAEVGAANVRELIGMVNRLIAYQGVSDGPITPGGARMLLTGEPPEKAAIVVTAPPAALSAPDEFSSFLSAVSTTVAQTVEAWRSRVGEAVLRWQGEGFRTQRLEQLLLGDEIPDITTELARFGAQVDELKRLAEEVAAFEPAAAGHACLRDPDALEEARAYAERVQAGVTPPPPPSRGLGFEGYVEGSANESAVRAAQSVCAEPGRRFNPLFITGASGTGKTHLLHAVGNALVAARAGTTVACLSAQVFMEELVAALDAGRVEWWRRRYRRADVLLLDDIQLLAGRDRSQEELFNLFNAFADEGRQLAFTADRAPAQLAGIAPRLTTRFEAGLVVELTAPDRPMRAEMVRRLLATRDVDAEDDVVQYLAARPADSARAVQGLVNRALSRMDPASEALTVETARLAVEGRPPRPSQAQAISATAPSGLDAVLGSREKVVWDWPNVGDRLVEELR